MRYNHMNSKIKQTKQSYIRRKIAQTGIKKAEEYEEIICNLINQRERLKTDLSLLKEKVVTLQQKQAQRQVTRNLRRRSSAPKNQINYREELNKKYEELKNWQKLSLKAMKNTRFQIQYKSFLDKVSWLQQEIQKTLRQLNDEYIINKRLRKALKISAKDQKSSNNVQESIEEENQALKKRIFSMKKLANQKINQEIYLHDYLIQVKEKDRVQQRRIESRLRKSSFETRKSSISRIKTQQARPSKAEFYSIINEQMFDSQITYQHITNQDQIHLLEGQLKHVQAKWKQSIDEIQQYINKNYQKQLLKQKRQGSKLTYGKEFEIMIEQIKFKIQQFSKLNDEKISLYLEAQVKGQYKTQRKDLIDKNISKFHQRQNTVQINNTQNQQQILLNRQKIRQVTLENQIIVKNLQDINRKQQPIQTRSTQFYDCVQLRKQFIGQLYQNIFFDKNILKKERQTSIKMLQIYYSDRGIATIKALYNIHSNNTTKRGSLLIPEQFLTNYCKVHTIDTNSGDFIRYFKLRYNILENRITQIKIVTNKNIKNGWGDAKIKGVQLQIDEQIQKQMVFDIDQDQYPVSIFCSHIQKGPYWYLCGFGVEIDDL